MITIALMRCPQCGAETPETEWNCVSCRMNVYWASRHYNDLARIRQEQGLSASAPTPPFLVDVHGRAMDERSARGGRVEHKVRQIARRAMRPRDDAGGTTVEEPDRKLARDVGVAAKS